MTKNKRFVNKGKDIFQYGGWWCSANGEHCADVITIALNEQHETINELKIENRELNNEVKLLCEFFRNNDFTLDDFNKWLTEDKWKWESKEVLEERFGDLND